MTMTAVDAPSVRDEDDAPCPVETAMQVIGGKWKVPILWHLQEEGVTRFADLRRALDGVSPKMLSQQLRELERDGMVHRTVYPTVPPRVEYALTPTGSSFRAALATLCAWGEHYLESRHAVTGGAHEMA